MTPDRQERDRSATGGSPSLIERASRLSVAPMMDWTDRHCRMLHRQFSARALLYTEMVTAPALVRGGALHLLDHDAAEHPLALQLGGSEPEELAEAARLGHAAGYGEINLNVGCPSDRVQSGAFGAVLMRDPDLVARCVAAMIAASPAEVTVKCRIGVDDDAPEKVLPHFLETVAAAGVRRFAIHARKAWLQGLSPKENRDVPPLDYPLVVEMKRRYPGLHVSVNGGIGSLEAAEGFLRDGLDGVMIGRAAYHEPAAILAGADRRIFGDSHPEVTAEEAARAMIPYIADHVAAGGRAHSVTRHMLGLFAGRPGARAWRRHLSTAAARDGAGAEIVEEALALIPGALAAE
ncbi:tRNA dihydrouridine(20/20a) synthase DusA [Poseidonocella sp. HB161398]|uniref:tRNA dihydrouridine(20/20a) synthase DusA n=1 Tax=Poseidonocella sp. HB161398 TaxID=2320855 RepID=UPI001109CEA3|nr:tRNA dihydrouridine(20/20a) synthase DusA [Poseidonocella sp. HB161398]